MQELTIDEIEMVAGGEQCPNVYFNDPGGNGEEPDGVPPIGIVFKRPRD